MINEPPKPATDAEKIALLLAASRQAWEWLEHYCNCTKAAKNIVCKDLRRAIQAATKISLDIPEGNCDNISQEDTPS